MDKALSLTTNTFFFIPQFSHSCNVTRKKSAYLWEMCFLSSYWILKAYFQIFLELPPVKL